MKLLTIAVPCYNVERTLARTLDSICLDEVLDRIEVILINDGSSDNTISICQKYAQLFPDTVCFVTKENGGHGSTINRGIREATGRYFRVVDGDDTLNREGFLSILEYLDSCDVDMLLSEYEKIDTSNPQRREVKAFRGVEYGKVYRFEELPDNGNLYFGIHSITYRTQILKDNGIKLQENTFYVDVEYGLLPLPYINTIQFYPRTVYQYWVGNLEQSISPKNFVNRYQDHERVLKNMIEYYENSAASHSQRRYMESVLLRVAFTQYMLGAFYDDDKKRGELRTRYFDSWLKEHSTAVYEQMNSNLAVLFMRKRNVFVLPGGTKFKRIIQTAYHWMKRLKKSRYSY